MHARGMGAASESPDRIQRRQAAVFCLRALTAQHRLGARETRHAICRVINSAAFA